MTKKTKMIRSKKEGRSFVFRCVRSNGAKASGAPDIESIDVTIRPGQEVDQHIATARLHFTKCKCIFAPEGHKKELDGINEQLRLSLGKDSKEDFTDLSVFDKPLTIEELDVLVTEKAGKVGEQLVDANKKLEKEKAGSDKLREMMDENAKDLSKVKDEKIATDLQNAQLIATMKAAGIDPETGKPFPKSDGATDEKK